jgi:hypothetical protein
VGGATSAARARGMAQISSVRVNKVANTLQNIVFASYLFHEKYHLSSRFPVKKNHHILF